MHLRDSFYTQLTNPLSISYSKSTLQSILVCSLLESKPDRAGASLPNKKS